MSEVLVLDAAQQDLPTHPLILSNICHLNVSNLARGGTPFPSPSTHHIYSGW